MLPQAATEYAIGLQDARQDCSNARRHANDKSEMSQTTLCMLGETQSLGNTLVIPYRY